MSDDISLCERLVDLLEYANIHLSLDTSDNLYLYRKLSSFLGLVPHDPQGYVPDSALLEKMTGPEQLLKHFQSGVRAKLMDALLPPPSKLIELFNSLLDNGDIRDATDWFYDLSLKSGYVSFAASESNIHWRPGGAKGGLHITINTSAPERDGCLYDYPRCISCENADYDIITRELPVFIRGEDWNFRFSPCNRLKQYFLFYPRSHINGRVGAETYARLINAVEYFPHYFFAANAEGFRCRNTAHVCFYGGLPQLPLFSAPPRIVFDNPEGLVKVSVPDWYNTVIRLESMQRHAILAMMEKISDAWANYSDPERDIVNGRGEKNNVIYPVVRINENGEYCAELILRNNKLPQPFGLLVPKAGLGVIESAGAFIFPAAIARVAETAYAVLSGSGKDAAMEKFEADDGLRPYDGMLADIEAKSSKDPQKAEADIESYIETACEQSLEAAAVFKEDARGNMALISFLTGLGLTVKR